MNIISGKKKIWPLTLAFFAIAEAIVMLLGKQWIYRLLGSIAILYATVLFFLLLKNGVKNTFIGIREHPWITSIMIACIVLLLLCVYFGIRSYGINSAYGKYALLVQIVLTPSFIFGLLGIYVWKLDTWKLYLGIGIFIGLGMMLVIPCGAVPDEIVHINTSYRLSNLLLGIKENGTGILMRKDDAVLAADTYARNSYYSIDNMEYYIGMLLSPLKNSQLVSADVSFLSLNPIQSIAYIPSAIGITAGRLLGLNTYLTLLLGRFNNLVLYITLTAFAIKLIPVGKLSLFVLSFMPMTVQQGMSFSYDCFLNACSFLVIAYTLEILLSNQKNCLSTKDKVILIFLTVFIASMKSYAYVLVAALPWIVQIYKYHPLASKQFHRMLKIMGIVLIMIIAVYIIWGFTGASGYLAVPSQLTFAGTLETPIDGYSISYFIGHPFEIFSVLAKTFKVLWDFYLISFIGEQLGWLDLPIPRIITLIYFTLLFFSSIKRMETQDVITTHMKLLFSVIIIGTLGFVLAGMLISWSPIDMGYIQGVQGRYFIPIALLVLLLIPSKNLVINQKADNIILLITLLSIFATIEVIVFHF